VPLPAGQTWVNTVTGDFDGDALTDTAAQTSAGIWWVTRTTASGTAAPTQWASLAIYQFPTVGDFNADGRDDLAVRNQEPRLSRGRMCLLRRGLVEDFGAVFRRCEFAQRNDCRFVAGSVDHRLCTVGQLPGAISGRQRHFEAVGDDFHAVVYGNAGHGSPT
jgi:hypothetical protein